MQKLQSILLLVVAGVFTICLLSAANRNPESQQYKLDYPDYFGNRYSIPQDNPTTIAGVKLGRMLFYEKALSAGNKMSCATCHKQEYAFSDGQNFSRGVDGTLQTRNTMALVNLLWVKNFFWDGRTRGLENQVEIPLTNAHEMGQPIDSSIKKLIQKNIYKPYFKDAFGDEAITKDRIAKALAQFERTLISGNSKYDQYLQGEYKPTAAELNGIKLFYGSPNPEKDLRGASCGHCHAGPKTYQELFMNNGLDSIYRDSGRAAVTGQDYDTGRFRVVTLRNIALTAPYMHDARFKTLEEVLDHYNEHLVKSKLLSPFLQNLSNVPGGEQLHLTASEKQDLVAFLTMLTDSSFITDKKFSDPFNRE